MLNFNHQSFVLKRPITLPSIAETLGVKPYELMHECLALNLYPAPQEIISDSEIQRLGNQIEADFTIEES